MRALILIVVMLWAWPGMCFTAPHSVQPRRERLQMPAEQDGCALAGASRRSEIVRSFVGRRALLGFVSDALPLAAVRMPVPTSPAVHGFRVVRDVRPTPLRVQPRVPRAPPSRV